MCRCQIAVHQECYGARDVQDFTNWVCRACELPKQKRECCLCPVKGIIPAMMLYVITVLNDTDTSHFFLRLSSVPYIMFI